MKYNVYEIQEMLHDLKLRYENTKEISSSVVVAYTYIYDRAVLDFAKVKGVKEISLDPREVHDFIVAECALDNRLINNVLRELKYTKEAIMNEGLRKCLQQLVKLLDYADALKSLYSAYGLNFIYFENCLENSQYYKRLSTVVKRHSTVVECVKQSMKTMLDTL